MLEKALHITQAGLGLLTLILVLAPVLAQGGNTPIAWSLLALFLLPVLFLQFAISLITQVPLAVQKLVLPGGLFLTAIGWAWVQTLPVPDPALAHPMWDFVPDAVPSISADPGQGRHAVMRLLVYASLFLVMVWTCVDAWRASFSLRAIAVFSTVFSGYGLFAFATGNNIFLGEFANPALVQSTFVNRNSFATYAVFGALANIAAFMHVSGRQEETLKARLHGFFKGAWIYALGALVCIGAVSLAQSRAGGIAGILGLVVFVIVWPHGNTRLWDKVMLGLLAAILIFISLTSATGLTERLLATSAEDGRFTVYPLVVDAIADRPLLGHGLGAFHDGFRPYVPVEAAKYEWVRAHNTYLELIFGLGLPAATALFAAIGLVALRIYRGTKVRRMNRAFSCFALGCLVTAGFHSVFDFSLQMPAVAALFSAILGLGYAQSFTYSEKKSAQKQEKVARTY